MSVIYGFCIWGDQYSKVQVDNWLRQSAFITNLSRTPEGVAEHAGSHYARNAGFRTVPLELERVP